MCLKIFFSIIAICFIGYTGIYCYNNEWSYYFFDILVKTISGIGTIIAGIFIYVKWQDEKTRSLYEKSLREVYTPLISELIKQEEYRQVLFPNLTFKEAPILSIKITRVHQQFNFSADGLSVKENKEEHPGILDRKNFLDSLKKDSYGLASPALLSCINKYEILLKLQDDATKTILETYPEFESDKKIYDKAMQTDEGKKLAKISHNRYEVELKLIQEIANGYNNCVKKLGMYDDIIQIPADQ